MKSAGLAFILPASALVGFLMGYGLDKLFGTHFLQWVFLALGILAGMIEAVRASQQP